mmetsp:Transcript_30394/g.73279  ORF Transcript_30394/g.73279 Transcript_30394/m.73279 type:complete len:213 (+) Transcript_30394:1035-1673(+)
MHHVDWAGESDGQTSNARKAGNASEHVLVRVHPVLRLLHALLVRRSKVRLALAGQDGHGKLCHGVKILGKVEDCLLDPLREWGALVHVVNQCLCLALGRHLARQEEPQQRFGEGLVPALGLGEPLLTLGDGQPTKTDALHRIQQRRLVYHTLDTTHTAVRLLNSTGAQNLVTIGLLHILDLLLPNGDLVRKDILQRRLTRHGEETRGGEHRR